MNQNAADKFLESAIAYYQEFIGLLPKIGIGILIVILGSLIAKLISSFYLKRIKRKTTDPLMARFLAQAIKISFILLAFMLALEIAGLSNIAAGVLTAAGGAAIILGFAFQDIGKNFLAGIILAFNRPFHINDTIMVGDFFGKVKALNFRYTHIKSSDGRDIFIPNADVLTKAVENYTADGFFRNEFIVGIGYEDNIEQAKEIIMGIINSQPEIIQNDIDHQNFVTETELAVNAVNLKVFFWVDTQDYRVSSRIFRGLIIRKVKEALDKSGFNLPANITELKLYKNTEDIPLRLKKD